MLNVINIPFKKLGSRENGYLLFFKKEVKMDLGAYLSKKDLQKILKNEPPRLRGLRLMKLQVKSNDGTKQGEIFNKYVGKDVLYIHTRCGGSNYTDYEMDKWEKENGAIEGINDSFDRTYRDSYVPLKHLNEEEYFSCLSKEQEMEKELVRKYGEIDL